MEITIKTDWSEVTIGEWQKLVSLQRYDGDKIDRELKILEILTNKSAQQLTNLSVKQMRQLLNKTKFMTKQPEGKLKYEYELNGQKYIPKLMIEDYEAGRFIDLMSLTKEEDKIEENLHIIIASVLHPIDKEPMWKFWKSNKVYDYNEMQISKIAEDVLNEMKVDDAMALALFFLRNYLALYQTIEDYSEGEKKQKLKENNPLTLILKEKERKKKDLEMKNRLDSVGDG